MPSKPAETTLIYDAFDQLGKGINSGVAPLKLPKDQCAYATNASFRGDYITNRAPFQKQNLIYNNGVSAANLTQVLFQEGGTYLSDGGVESLVCQVSGRLLLITPDASGNCTVSDITVPNNPNPATNTIAWMWQAENYLIVQDGSSIPVFYDGSVSRRSVNAGSVVATLVAAFTPSNIGGQVVTTLASPYTGPINQVLALAGFDAKGNSYAGHFEVTQAGITSSGGTTLPTVTLQNINATPGVNYTVSTAIKETPNQLGTLARIQIVSQSGNMSVAYLYLNIPLPSYAGGGSQIHDASAPTATITIGTIPGSISTDRKTLAVSINDNGFAQTYSPGDLLTLVGASSGQTTVATSNGSSGTFTAPVVGSNVVVTLTTTAYAGPINQLVQVGANNDLYLLISADPGSTTSANVNNITLQNLNMQAPPTFVAGATLSTLPELPPGRMGAYGLGRVWQSGIDGVTFLGGDIVNGSSGSAFYGGRDAVLKVTENASLFEGNPFRIPGNSGQITAMSFPATMDASLGQGPLQIFTGRNIFSCQAPVDYTLWTSLTSPVLTQSLRGSGAAGQGGVVLSNADIIFRSPDANLRSLTLARLDFSKWGNTPISFEMNRVTQNENETLMQWCSGVEFNNRILMLANPTQTPYGVVWNGMISLNEDPISSLQGKESSIYEGVWDTLTMLKIVRFTSVDRCFAFILNSSNTIEVHEILQDAQSLFDDAITKIDWSFETPVLFQTVRGKGEFDLLKLEDGEIYISDVATQCTISVWYRPDYDNQWHQWTQFSIGADNSSPTYYRRVGLGRPSNETANTETAYDRPAQYGSMFQFKFEIVGNLVFKGARFTVSSQPDTRFARPVDGAVATW